jgi:hypothetical protein
LSSIRLLSASKAWTWPFMCRSSWHLIMIISEAQKEIILTDRYQHLSQNKSKLHKSIERKRKKLDGKDKKSMPLKRTRPAEA